MRPALAVPAVMSTALKGRTHGRTDQCCKREEYSCQLGAVHSIKACPLAACVNQGRSEEGMRRNRKGNSEK